MNRTAEDRTRELLRRQYQGTGVFLNIADAETLRRAELTLHRWAEEVCNGTIQREGDSGKAYRHTPHIPYKLASYGAVVPDREAGALRRVADVCRRNGLDYYHQGDPRGCALYISKAGAGMNDTNYNQFVACSVN